MSHFKSHGKCEICGEAAVCYDVQSKKLATSWLDESSKPMSSDDVTQAEWEMSTYGWTARLIQFNEWQCYEITVKTRRRERKYKVKSYGAPNYIKQAAA